MNDRSKLVLAVLFFGSLLGLWYADSARLPTLEEKQRLTGRVLPALLDADLGAIDRIEVVRGDQSLEFRRRDDGRWRMTAPIDTLASRSLIEAFLYNLKALRRLPDAGTITKSAAEYGLDDAPTLRLYRKGESQPLASLRAGREAQDRRYVRAEGSPGIEVVDAQPLSALDLAPEDWRERAIFPVSPLDVIGLAIDGPDRSLEVERRDGRWRLTRPIRGPVDLTKLDAVLADLAALQVTRDAPGFVADGVRDFAPYGLDSPRLTIRLTPDPRKGGPVTVAIGKDAPNAPGRVFARRGDQAEVVLVPGRALEGLGADPHALRSRRMAEFDPAKVVRVRIDREGAEDDLVRTAAGWEAVKPSRGRADTRVVQELIARLADAQASDFLDPSAVADPGLDRPTATIRIWEAAATGDPAGEPAPVLDLRLGRVDRGKKTVFARVAGDPAIVALPDNLTDALPSGPLAFRERAIVTLGPGRIDRIAREQGSSRIVVQAPGEPNDFARWQMTEPVRAPVDAEAVARLSVLLSALRAEGLVAAEPESPEKYGLDAPWLAIAWNSRQAAGPRRGAPTGGPASGILRIGATVGRGSESRFAAIDGQPLVFTLGPQALAILQGELHDRRVVGLPAEKANRLEIVQGEGTASWSRPRGVPGVPGVWKADPGNDSAAGADRVEALATALARLLAVRFVQYDGAFPEATGLDSPRATFRLIVEGVAAPVAVRVGAATAGGLVYATTAQGPSGAVFLVPRATFEPWIGPPGLPADPFAKDED